MFLESLKAFDKKKLIMKILESTKMDKLSSEIKKLSAFTKHLYLQEKSENALQFMVCLDFLTKGLLAHWQIKLSESVNSKQPKDSLIKSSDLKQPILIGDQFHSMAYYVVARMGNIELTRTLTIIEENFQKVCYNLESINNNFEHNLRFIYQHFYNYLPSLFGHGLKGIALIFDLGQVNIKGAF
mmetsp:Transcript_12903/g.12795  ORF Transcript_12903/g.12795 Transcript_12903/m.12795 type:complete len:184 (+) Transcript_12903:383-934(+)